MADHKGARCCGRCLGRGWYRKGKLTVDCERGCSRVEPAPVRLSAGMLGEEDRKRARRIKAALVYYCGDACGDDAEYQADIAFLDRLLGKGE